MVPKRSSYLDRRSVHAALAISLLLALVLSAAVFARPNQPAATHVRCDPVNKVALIDENFTIDIYVEDVQDLRAVDVRMSYDPLVIEPLDGDPQAAGVNLEPLAGFYSSDFFLRNGYNLVDGANENVPIWYAALQQGTGSSGSGAIARMHFKPLQSGQFAMAMLETKLAAFGGASITHTKQDCLVTIVDPSEGKISYVPVVARP